MKEGKGTGGDGGDPDLAALTLLLVLVGVSGEALLFGGPDPLGQQRGPHFPLLLKAAGARDL